MPGKDDAARPVFPVPFPLNRQFLAYPAANFPLLLVNQLYTPMQNKLEECRVAAWTITLAILVSDPGRLIGPL